MKIISMSLFGTDTRYADGAIKNAILAKKYFPEWRLRIYTDYPHDSEYINELKLFDNVDIYPPVTNIVSGYFWRFMPAFESDDNIVLVRDTDSRLSLREKTCVDAWLDSDARYLIIRDHPTHYEFPMLAGMWASKGKLNNEFLYELYIYDSEPKYFVDQIYLGNVVWRNDAHDNSMIIGIHENQEFANSRKLVGNDFVGQGYYGNDIPIYPNV